MKLELKHITPYLPYSVEVVEVVRNKVISDPFVVDMINFNGCNIGGNDAALDSFESERAFSLYQVKPLLRPLSSITKEEASKLLSKVQGVSINEDTLRVFNNNNNTIIIQYEYPNDYLWCLSLSYTKALIATPYTIYGSHKSITPTPMFIYDWFIKNHFDVFGLIDRGLAIDKTTFK